MFGKKKEEDWEYISAENYFDENENSRILTEEEKQEIIKETTSTDFLEELFRPFLLKNEQILCVIGGGKGDPVTPFEDPKYEKVGEGLSILKRIVKIAPFIGAVILLISGNIILIALGFLLIILSGILNVIVPVIGATATLAWGIDTAPQEMNYAVTDRRVLIYGYQILKQIDLRDIFDVKATVVSGDTGRVTVKAGKVDGQSVLAIFTFPKVKEPFRVKYIIDKAIEKRISENPDNMND
ncbi:MAG: hypothetical protein IJL33_08490 [Ruminococcus sp.]|nr:hypothetical protein [Ruminococcus sp.]